MNKIDVVLGLQYGDEGKGKITNQMAKSGDYDYVMRYNGGGNAGHTIYDGEKKVVTHLVPCGVLHGIPSIIGSGCVLNINNFFIELDYLEGLGYDTSLIKVAYNCHIVTDDHILEDSKDVTIGTTRTGNGPCYRDKVTRVGKRAEDFKELSQFIIDISVGSFSGKVLAEGAQGYWLDVDQGDYPYVTSSNCGVGAVINNGFSHKEINKVVGVAKAYSTYVGAKQYQKTDDPIFEEIRKVGLEYGATTGRSRQIDWLDLNELSVACMRNGVDHLIINKLDVLEQLNCWKIYDPNHSINKILNFESKDLFKDYIRNEISSVCSGIEIEFQESPH